MDSSEPKEKPIESQSVDEKPDVLFEHGSTRLSLDLTGFEWMMLTIIIAIVGVTIYFTNP